MQTTIVEVTNGPRNWGKFLIGRLDSEWSRRSVVDGSAGAPLLSTIGMARGQVLVLDLQTREGAMFLPHGFASIDLNEKHRIWVCPLFEPFLTWLYAFAQEHKADWFDKLPEQVDLPDAPFAMRGHRREGHAGSSETR